MKFDSMKDIIYNKFINEQDKIARQTVIVAELYQAIKRINRNNNKIAKIYIINNDQQILDKLLEQVNNIKVKEYSLNLEYKISEKKAVYAKEQADNSNYYAFIRFISTLSEGVYQKKCV